jgi:hypothetical protein
MYFTMSQAQYLGLAIFGGLILIAIVAIGYWSYKLHLARKTPGEEQGVTVEPESGDEKYADGMREGHEPVPLLIILLIGIIIVWGVGYTLAHAFGVFYAQ